MDNLYELETKLIQNPSQSLIGLQGSYQDKIRLFLMYYILNNGQVAASEIDQFQTGLSTLGEEDPQTVFKQAFDFVKKWM